VFLGSFLLLTGKKNSYTRSGEYGGVGRRWAKDLSSGTVAHTKKKECKEEDLEKDIKGKKN
jgi:hypothetical protein